jgi:hypothetical protein
LNQHFVNWVPGKVTNGHGVASGQAQSCPYPSGSISLQAPYFLQRGIDLSDFYAGTLNVDLAPFIPRPGNVIFDETICWFGNITERFMLAPIELEFGGCQYKGLWYYPHPGTKPAHFQRDTVVELLLPWIEGLSAGMPVLVRM